MPKELLLQNGMKAIVDDEDYVRASQYQWKVRVDDNKHLFVYASPTVNGKRMHIALNQLILNQKPEPKQCIIFQNQNELDFQKSNLKIVPRTYAMQRHRGWENSTSKYKGVCWKAKHKKWVAQIHIGKTSKYLGLYDTEEEAALVYNEAARLYMGEHAYQNVLPKSKYTGVTEADEPGKWQAIIGDINIGVFDSEEEAAMAYNVIALEMYGEKATLNEI